MTNMIVYLIGTLLVVAGLAYAADRAGITTPTTPIATITAPNNYSSTTTMVPDPSGESLRCRPSPRARR